MENHLENNQMQQLLTILKQRYETNMYRHAHIEWAAVYKKLSKNPIKLLSLYQMEEGGGEPDVVVLDSKSFEVIFYDYSIESPKGRRSLCYDRDALLSRKDHLPLNSVLDMVNIMGLELLNEEQYQKLQTIFSFDLKTSSWIYTPNEIRQKGSALFCDYRYGRVFIYHNDAQSYYSSRGFRALLRI